MDLFGICQLTMIPVRNEPSDKSEMVTQLLFGETFDIIRQINGWSEIITHFDSYRGWISTSMSTQVDKETINVYNHLEYYILKENYAVLQPGIPNTNHLILAGGSKLITEKIQHSAHYPWYIFKKPEVLFPESGKEEIKKNAFKFLNAPYLWGGRTIFGIDCSGFTQILYKMAGYNLPRDAHQQSEKGIPLDKVEDALPCDLAFFVNNEGLITHTGVILENFNIIHSSGKVRLDKIDNSGILNSSDNTYSHKLRLIKRVIDLYHR